MALKEYKDAVNTKKILKGTIRSGIKSGDSETELLLAEPLQKHPEIEGLYRAFDPTTNWRGWVPYEPPKPPAPEPVVQVPPTQAEIEARTWREKYRDYKRMQELVADGIVPESELTPIREELKQLYKPGYKPL